MDDVFYIHNDPNKYLNLVEGYFHLKDPLECHIVYLRSDISKFEIPYDTNGVTCWAMSIDSHVKKSLQVFESKLKEENFRCKPPNKTMDYPFSRQSYRPNIYVKE